jgi:hypothetical protein
MTPVNVAPDRDETSLRIDVVQLETKNFTDPQPGKSPKDQDGASGLVM